MTYRPNTPVIIWDIDGVLADDRVRATAYVSADDQFIEPRSLRVRPDPDWDAYYGDILGDLPITNLVTIYNALSETTNYTPVFLTGRSERYYAETERWLIGNVDPMAGSPLAPIVMRREGSKLSNKDEKASHFEFIKNTYGVPVMAFEDNDEAVQFYRDQGVTCLQPSKAYLPRETEPYYA